MSSTEIFLVIRNHGRTYSPSAAPVSVGIPAREVGWFADEESARTHARGLNAIKNYEFMVGHAFGLGNEAIPDDDRPVILLSSRKPQELWKLEGWTTSQEAAEDWLRSRQMDNLARHNAAFAEANRNAVKLYLHVLIDYSANTDAVNRGEKFPRPPLLVGVTSPEEWFAPGSAGVRESYGEFAAIVLHRNTKGEDHQE